MNNTEIPKTVNNIYLKLPIGDDKFKENFIKKILKNVKERFTYYMV